MARERFLINPPKRRRLKKSVRKISRRLKFNSWSAHPVEHKRASLKGWRRRRSKTAGYAIPKGASFPRSASKTSRKRSSTIAERHYLKGNPLSEEVILMGANPKRRKRKSSAKRRRRNPITAMTNPRKKLRRNYAAANPKRRKYVRKSARRRHRRNPAAVASGINFMRPMSLIAPAMAGIAALYLGTKVPAMLNMTTGLPKYGVKVVTAIGGQMLIKQVLRRNDLANVFAIVSLVQIGYEALNEYVLTGLGFAALPYGYAHTAQLGYGAFPEQVAVSGYGAVPSEVGVEY